MNLSQITNENAEDLNIGDPVIITGNVQFKGKTGDIVDFGKDKRFVIVNLYNYGKHSFHSSDVSYNDYAESGDEQEYLSQFESKMTEAKSLQSKFEKHLAKHGYDVAEKSKYWEKKLKDIDAQIAAWDAEMAARKQSKGVAEGIFDIFKKLPAPGSTVKIAGRPVEITHAGIGSDYIGFAWTDKNGKEHYEETPADEHNNLRSLAKTIAAEIKYADDDGVDDELDAQIKGRLDRHFSKNKGVTESVNGIVQQILSESRLGDFLPPFRANGLSIDDRRGNSVAQVVGHGSLAKEVANALNQYVSKKGVAEGEYDDPRWEEEPHYKRFDPDAWKELRDREEEEAAMSKGKPSTVTVRDAEGNVVLQFPSTGGYYGDVRTAKAKGFDTEAGDYDIKWQKNEDAMMSEDTGATSEQVAAEIVRRIIFKHKDAISAFGPEAIMAAAREVGEFFAGAEELGTSDIGIATKYTLEKLDQMSRGALGESASAGATGAGNIATNLTGGAGKNVGSLFGGSYKQKRTKKSPGTK